MGYYTATKQDHIFFVFVKTLCISAWCLQIHLHGTHGTQLLYSGPLIAINFIFTDLYKPQKCGQHSPHTFLRFKKVIWSNLYNRKPGLFTLFLFFVFRLLRIACQKTCKVSNWGTSLITDKSHRTIASNRLITTTHNINKSLPNRTQSTHDKEIFVSSKIWSDSTCLDQNALRL